MDNRLIAGALAVSAAAVILILAVYMAPTGEEALCGDGICDEGETCEDCPPDCGGCEVPDDDIPDKPNCEENLTWCAQKDRCIDPESEHCVETPFGARIGEAANEKWGGARIYPNTSESAVEGWWRISLSVPKKANMSHLCYIFMRGDSVRNASGAYFLEHGPVNISGNEVCEIEVTGGPVRMCESLLVHIDIEAMKESYDLETDNWQDFFSCETGFGSDFCQEECDAMMEELMKSERSPLEIIRG